MQPVATVTRASINPFLLYDSQVSYYMYNRKIPLLRLTSLLTIAKCVQLPCYADRLTSVLCGFSSLVIRNRHRVAMYFHAPCGVVLYSFVCKLYANKEKKIILLNLPELNK